MDERELLMKKLSGAGFAALEMQLYLDTHKKDAKALKSMREYQRMAMEYKNEYEQKYGPITVNDPFGDSDYRWLNPPWPWENESELIK